MLMLRMLPLGLFGVFGGEIASRFNRRIVLLAMFAGSTGSGIAADGPTPRVLTFLVCATVFAHSALPLLTGALLIVFGVSMAAFAAMQSVLVLQYALVDGRQRMMGLLSACIGSGPIGLLHLGLMAAWFGASAACTIIAVEGLVALGLVALKWRGLIGGQRPP